jgi:hypothetical protein
MLERILEGLAARLDRCPPHQFRAVVWGENVENAQSVLYCRRCGDVRQLAPASIMAPELEVLTIESDAG